MYHIFYFTGISVGQPLKLSSMGAAGQSIQLQQFQFGQKVIVAGQPRLLLPTQQFTMLGPTNANNGGSQAILSSGGGGSAATSHPTIVGNNIVISQAPGAAAAQQPTNGRNTGSGSSFVLTGTGGNGGEKSSFVLANGGGGGGQQHAKIVSLAKSVSSATPVLLQPTQQSR